MAEGKDGGLRSIFRRKLHTFHWNTIEVGILGSGIPDNEFCTPTGVQAWIEFKQTHIFQVKFQPFQAPWLDRRCRYGGNAWIAVRRRPQSQREAGADELWLIRGDQALALQKDGLEYVHATVWEGGPSHWNFNEIAGQLCNR
jgi:hypothetical protein